MKLTIVRLQQFSPQDKIDLQKIWPGKDLKSLKQWLDDNHRLYAARFNDRLLAAVCVELSGAQGKLSHLQVREATRRRGVGQYLIEDTLVQNSSISQWWIAEQGDEEQSVVSAFMQACGFRAQNDGWVRVQE